MTTELIAFLFDGDEASKLTVVLAHGAGAPMDSPFMDAMAAEISKLGLRVARFEFPYMAKRRIDGKKRGPDRAPVLIEYYGDVVRQLGDPAKLIIGGKSMGGRLASMVADELGVGRPCVPRLSVPSARKAREPSDRASHGHENTCADLSWDARSIWQSR